MVLSLHDMSLVEEYGWWIVGQNETIGLKVCFIFATFAIRNSVGFVGKY